MNIRPVTRSPKLLPCLLPVPRWRVGLVSLACVIAWGVNPPEAMSLVIAPGFPGEAALTLGNNEVVQIDPGPVFRTPLGFDLQFNPGIFISSNGYVVTDFASGTTPFNRIPGASSSLATVQSGSFGVGREMEIFAPFWADLDPSLGGTVTMGSPAPGVFAVSWVGVPYANAPGTANTFQLVLVSSSGFKTTDGIDILPKSIFFGYGSLSPIPAGLAVDIGIAGSEGEYLNTLGIGDSAGFVTSGALASLTAADPFLFQGGNRTNPPLITGGIEGLTLAPVPEPSTLLLLGGGLAGLAWRSYRRRPILLLR